MTLEKYDRIYSNSYLNRYYLINKSQDGWCYETDLGIISDNNKNLKLIASENTILDILVVPDFDDNVLQLERSSFQLLRTDIKSIYAWRIVPTHYRLKGTEFKKPEWLKETI